MENNDFTNQSNVEIQNNQPNTKKGKGLIIILIIVFILILGCVIAYGFYMKYSSDNEITNLKTKVTELENKNSELNIKNNELENKTTDCDENDIPIPITNTIVNTLEFDENNIVTKNKNNFKYIYTLYSPLDGYNFVAYISNNNVYLSSYNYKINWKITNFNKKVVDIFISIFGQEYYGTVVFFLMEDGTVEYLPVAYALKNNNIKSYGKINGLNDIVKFYSVGTSVICDSDGGTCGGGKTIFAQNNKGELFDIKEIMDWTEYFKDVVQ